MATRTITDAGGNYGTAATWVENAVPTNADNVVATATSGNLVVNVASECLNFDLTGYLGTLSGDEGLSVYGSFTLGSGMTWSKTSNITFAATSTGKTINTNGVSITTLSDYLYFSGVGGGWTLLDDLILSSGAGGIALYNGAVDTNDFTVETFVVWINGGETCSIDLGASIINASYGFLVSNSAVNLTVICGTSTINTKNFDGGGKTYHAVVINPDYPGSLGMMLGLDDTFEQLTYISDQTLTLHEDITVTDTLTLQGVSPTSRGSICSSLVGTQRGISADVTTLSDFVFKDIAASGDATWTGTRIVDGGNNTGINFPNYPNFLMLI